MSEGPLKVRCVAASHLMPLPFLPLPHSCKTCKSSKICANPVIQAVFGSVYCDFFGRFHDTFYLTSDAAYFKRTAKYFQICVMRPDRYSVNDHLWYD